MEISTARVKKTIAILALLLGSAFFLNCQIFDSIKPTNLHFVNATSISVTLEWNDNSLSEGGYLVLRKGPGETQFQQLTSLSANSYQFVDRNDLQPGAAYSYQVAAFGVNARREYREVFSNVIEVMVPTSSYLDLLPPPVCTSSNKVVVGRDDRGAMLCTHSPWDKIGKLLTPDGSWCTASLVGPNIIATAAHCIYNSKGELYGPIEEFRFVQNYKGEDLATLSSQRIAYGVANSHRVGTTLYLDEPRYDWALLKIDQRLGDLYGYFGYRTLSIEELVSLGSNLATAGYSEDFNDGLIAGLHSGCRARGEDVDLGLIEHDCDTSYGASGSVVFANFADGGFQVVMVHRGRSGEETINHGVKLDEFSNVLSGMLTEEQVVESHTVSVGGEYRP